MISNKPELTGLDLIINSYEVDLVWSCRYECCFIYVSIHLECHLMFRMLENFTSNTSPYFVTIAEINK